jgi:tetratricopeptide (TPR) repeat protein
MRPGTPVQKALLGLLAATVTGCTSGDLETPVRGRAVAIGSEPVARVHLYENHSSSLIAWRTAEVQNRVVVHLDGHLDFDWIPDETVARIAAATPDELSDLQSHPYALDNDAYTKFGDANFMYAAARLGIVRKLIWVVPDATFEGPDSFARLAAEILDHVQMVSLDEALGLHREGNRLEGRLLGLSVTICRLSDLPDVTEPVLLDIDLDYFTIRSAVTGWITERPWTTPSAVLRELENRGFQTDLVTIAFSTIGGRLPPANRWMGPALQHRLRSSGHGIDPAAQVVFDAEQSESSGDAEGAARQYGKRTELVPHDASGWSSLAKSLTDSGRAQEASKARARAIELDPLLEHEDLFEADRLYANGQYERARESYRAYLKRMPESAFRDWALLQNARSLVGLNRLDDAMSAYRYLITIVPDHADSHMDLGRLHEKLGRVEAAVQELRIARDLVPENPAYAMTLGTLLAEVGWLEESAEQLQAAVELRPSWYRARGILAHVLHGLGRDDEAELHLRAGLSLQPHRSDPGSMELLRDGLPSTPVQTLPRD